MRTFNNISNGESGSSVRGKLNNVLTSIISGSEGINAIWAKIESVTQRINGMDSGISHIVKDTSYNPSSLDPYKNAVLIALCTGTFNNIKDKNGTPITIPGSNALTIFYRAANTTYWEYDTQVISTAVDSYESNDHTKIESSNTHVITHGGTAIKPMTDFNSVYDLDGNNLTKTVERLHTDAKIVLASMGTAVDNEGNDSDVAIMYVPSVGDRYYDSETGHIKWVKSSTVTEDLGLPSEDRIYCNRMTQRLYVFRNGWKKVGEPNEDLTSLKSNVASNSKNIQSIVRALSTKKDKLKYVYLEWGLQDELKSDTFYELKQAESIEVSGTNLDDNAEFFVLMNGNNSMTIYNYDLYWEKPLEMREGYKYLIHVFRHLVRWWEFPITPA